MRTKLLAVMVVLAVVLGGVWMANTLRSGSADETVQGEAETAVFALVDAAHRELDGSPALALSFSRPLDRRGNYDKYVQVYEMPARPQDKKKRSDDDDEDAGSSVTGRVSQLSEDIDIEKGTAVSGAWVVGENPRLLFFPHIKPETRYVVKIMPGLPARDGAALDSEARYSILTDAMAPAFYFASKGMVLPAVQNGGLPVTTVNVPEVDIQFLRIKPDQVPKFLNQVIAGRNKTANDEETDESGEDEGDYYGWYSGNQRLQGAVSSWYLDRIHGMTESVYAGRFLTEQKPNRRAVTFIPVEDISALREPGIYVAVMSMPNRFRDEYQTTYFYVSDLGLHVRQFSKGADAYVSSLTDGKAVDGVDISWLDAQGKILRQSVTKDGGRAVFDERPAGAQVVLARKGSQISMIALKEPALDLSEYDITGNPYAPVRLFAYSGRDLYRPGEQFEVSVLARDDDGHPVPAQPVEAILRRPDGKNQFSALWQPDQGVQGYYRRVLDLPPDAPTGFWTLELRSDPASKLPGTQFRFGVEEFLPERMKLDLNTKVSVLTADHPLIVQVDGAYLYGAPAAGNRLLGVANFERNRNPLAQSLPSFEFGDVGEDSVRIRHELEENKLDESGKAQVEVALSDLEKRRSPFTVRTTLSLLESGGRPVVRSIERVVWPAPVLVGVRPLFSGAYAPEGSSVEFEVVRADAKGALKAGVALPARLFRENRNYYWRFDDQRGWHSGFSESDELVGTANVTVPEGGRGKLTLPVKYGRYRLEVLDPETSQTLRYRFYAGWSAKEDETQGVRPDRVALKFDKPAYREGEVARLTITPPHGGEALVTVEGDRGLWAKRLAIPVEGTTIDIPVDAGWKRHDLYVSAMVLRPGNQGERVTPARALGIAYLPLERGERKLAVALEAPKKMEPSQPLKVKIKVPEAKGTQAVVTLSAVDVGILNITRFASPDPFAFFFGKLRYGADQYDVYGRVIEKMAGQKGKLKFGGDSTPGPTRSLPKKVRLVDLFSGPVMLDAQGEAEVVLPVPDFNGSLRLMAVVAGADRFGSQEAEVTVAAPMIAELATPRFLSTGDTAVLALDLQNLSGSEQAVKVHVANQGGLIIRKGDHSLNLKDQQKTTLRIPIEAGTAMGITEVSVKVETPRITLDRTFPLQVQPATPRQTVVRRFTIQPGETVTIQDAGLSGLQRNTVDASLSVSDTPPIDVRSAIQGLLTYPYGCAEQTTSTAYPHVLIDEAGARLFGLPAYTHAKRTEMVEKAISRLAGMQAPGGGFSLWGNPSEYEYWLSAYVTNFLLDAREQGFDVPPEMHKRAMDYLLRGLQEGVAGLPAAKPAYNENSVWSDRRYAGAGRYGVLAYGAYVLARENKAPLATLRQMNDLQSLAYSGLPLVHLGLALKLMGDEERATQTLTAGVKKPRDAKGWWGDYGSVVRDAALSYVLLEKHKVSVEGKSELVMTVASAMGDRQYYSTQERMALFLLGRNFTGQGGKAWQVEWRENGKQETLDGRGMAFRPVQTGTLVEGVQLHNNHSAPLYAELSLQGHMAKMPEARRDAFDLKRTLYTAAGEPLANRPLRVGETVLVRLEVTPKVNIANGMIVDSIPAGLEIENLNLAQGEQMDAVTVADINPLEAMQNSAIQHVEFRDDRFVVAARMKAKMNFFYRARVVTPGRFVVPPTYAEDMYNPQISGVAGGGEMMTITDGRGTGDWEDTPPVPQASSFESSSMPDAPLSPAAPESGTAGGLQQ